MQTNKKAEHENDLKLANDLKQKSNLSQRKWWKLAKSFVGFNHQNSFPPIKDD